MWWVTGQGMPSKSMCSNTLAHDVIRCEERNARRHVAREVLNRIPGVNALENNGTGSQTRLNLGGYADSTRVWPRVRRRR